MAAYTLIEDATSAAATCRIVDDSYDCPHSNNSVEAGINNLIVHCGVPWYDRWIVYEIYTAVARDTIMSAIYGALKSADPITIRGIPYYMTECSCTDAIFTDDLAVAPEVKSWKYHMAFVREGP